MDSRAAVTVVHSRAPLRISLAGGGTDVPPYPERFGGAVVSLAISCHAWAELRLTAAPGVVLRSHDTGEVVRAARVDDLACDGRLDVPKVVARALHRAEGGLELSIASSVPPRSGLGGSAALFVATVAAFDALEDGGRRDRHELAELAWRLEHDGLGNACGRQDPYAATFGGLNGIEFDRDGSVRVEPLPLPPGLGCELERRLLLFYVGERPAQSGVVIARQAARAAAGANLEALHRTRALARDLRSALLAGDLDEVGPLLHRAWQEKKRFAEGITHPGIDATYDELRAAGALGGKLTGAGGGGHMLVYVPLARRAAVRAAALRRGLAPVSWAIDATGVQTWTPPACLAP